MNTNISPEHFNCKAFLRPRQNDAPPPNSGNGGNGGGDTVQVGSDDMGDPYFPKMGNGGYHAKHYDLNLQADPSQNQLTASTTMEASADQNLQSFDMDFAGDFNIGGLTVNGAPAKFERQDGGELVITPDKPLTQGQDFSVKVDYSGQPKGYNSPHAPIPLGWNATEDGSYVLDEPDGASSWFPVNDHPRDKATYTFHVTVPSEFTAVANGELVSQNRDGDKTTFVYDNQTPMASYLATVDVGHYVQETSKSKATGVPIVNSFGKSVADAAHTDFSRVGEMIDWFSQRFGPYPFASYGNIVLDADVGGAALETQTRPIFERGMVTGDQSLEFIYAHELAHQWFGDSVSVKNWKDIWLNEGFANYAHMTWRYEHDGGIDKLDRAMHQMYRFLPRESSPVADPGTNDMFDENVYNRGACALHVLRKTIGDEKFFQCLQTYTSQFKDHNATTDDFVGVVNQVTGKDMTSFFDQWVKQSALPDWPAKAGMVPEAPLDLPLPKHMRI